MIQLCPDFEVILKNKANKTKNKRKITIAGDSMLKGITQQKMRESVSRNDVIYLKSFSGATIADMKDYIKPSLKHSPSLVVLHTCTNDLHSTKNASMIAAEVLDLAKFCKTNLNVVLISAICVRRDNLNEKGIAINNILRIECHESGYEFCSNNNMNLQSFKCLRASLK